MFIDKYDIDTNEVRVYTEIIPKLIQFEKNFYNGQSRLEEFLPKFYAGGADKQTKGFFLIMEDLSEKYRMVTILQSTERVVCFMANSINAGSK